jgi:hypothetical protein
MNCMTKKLITVVLFFNPLVIRYKVFQELIIRWITHTVIYWHCIVWVTDIHSFIHLAVCLITGSKPLPKQALHIVWSRASSFRCEYPVLSLKSSSSFLHLLSCLPVTSIPPSIFPSITCHRRQFLHKMWPIQLAFHLLISCRIFLFSLSVSNNA